LSQVIASQSITGYCGCVVIEATNLEQRALLQNAMARLAMAKSFDMLVETLRDTARAIARADGVSVVRRQGDRVHYLAEDAFAPLWAGQDFAIEQCISGLAILERQPIYIADIYADSRVPHAAYRPTFVKSMAMFPIGLFESSMAMGVYWRDSKVIDSATTSLLGSLARYAGVTLSRVTEGRGADAA
jgi:hypothetical protein